jgi:hypothetical protein
VKLEHNVLTEKWTIVNNTNHLEEEKQLNSFIAGNDEFLRVAMGYTLDERIQDMLELFDDYFSS